MEVIKRVPNYAIDVSRLTYCNTHGDYTINQLICQDRKIAGVVDWTSACKHPVIWELTRSFMYAEPSCADGTIDRDKLDAYVKLYEKKIGLNEYDKKHLIKLYLYQLFVCDYYGQYLTASEQNRDEFLWQAKFATKVLRKSYKELGI